MATGEQAERVAEREQLTVSQLTAQIKLLLESRFPAVWVSGELADVSRPGSGHIYLTLKDERAQIRAVIWRSVARTLRFELEDGQQVVCLGEVGLYAPRGSYQLIVRQIEPRGVGALQLALRQLEQRLAGEGLFRAERKRRLPKFPRRVALVTSPTGAAVRDFLEVARRRWRAVQVSIVPCRVQGPGSADEVARAIELANQLRPAPDVLVVTRGGGSLEDLWSFNEERVVRAIFASRVPVVSAVGHEIDVSLSDLVADVRALTPTEAAELVVPSRDDVGVQLAAAAERLAACLRARAAQARARLELLAGRRALRRPLEGVFERMRQVDELECRARRGLELRLERSRQRLVGLAGHLDSLSPLGVLARGYSLTLHEPGGAVVRDAARVASGDRLRTRLGRGELLSRVEQVVLPPDGASRSAVEEPLRGPGGGDAERRMDDGRGHVTGG